MGNDTANRKMFFIVDRELVAPLSQRLRPNELFRSVASLRQRLHDQLPFIKTTNSNLQYRRGQELRQAQRKWPAEMIEFNAETQESRAKTVLQILAASDADAIVIPYYDPNSSASAWPCVVQTTMIYDQKFFYSGVPGFVCPDKGKQELAPLVRRSEDSPYLKVFDSNLFAVVRLRPEFSTAAAKDAILRQRFDATHYPIVVKTDDAAMSLVLAQGWHAVEGTHVWSAKSARLNLPVPKECGARQCFGILTFNVFGASEDRPVAVNFAAKDFGPGWSTTILAKRYHGAQVAIPLPGATQPRRIAIEVPSATSPSALFGSIDGRTLGIDLERVDLVAASGH